MKKTLHLLILEDSPDDVEMIVAHLRQSKYRLDFQHVVRRQDFVNALYPPLDLIITDYTLPDLDGGRAIELARQHVPDVPVVVVTGTVGEERAVRCVKLGAADFLLKDHLARLGSVVRKALLEQRLRHRRRRAQQALRDSEEKWHKLFELSIDAITVYDAESLAVLDASPATLAMLGYTLEEMRALKATDISAEPEATAATLREAAQRGTARVPIRRLRTRSGEIRLAEISTSAAMVSGRSLLFAVLRDVTERVRADEALRASEARYRDLVENSSDILWEISDWEGTPRYSYVSPNVAWILGIPAEAIVGRSLWDFLGPEEQAKLAPVLGAVVAGRKPYTMVRHRMRHGDGTVRMLEASARPVLDASGKLLSYRGVSRDITERWRTQEALHESETQLRQAQKMEAVGRLAGGVAHDFNNMLTAVTGYTELLLMDMGRTDSRRAALEEIKAASDRAAALTRQLLAFSRKQILAPRALDLNGIVEGLEKMLRRLIGEDITFNTHLQAGLPLIEADPGQLEQVILNLAVNARDAMPQGGRLNVDTMEVDLDGRRCGDLAAGRYVTLEVTDTGCGMDADTAARIFEPFFTTKQEDKGTGLGLSTVFGIVKQSNGDIEVESEVGKGATFRIYFPPSSRSVVERPTGVLEGRAGGGPETVLIVEDEQAVRDMTQQLLRLNGYHVLTAANGQEALTLLSTLPTPPELLLTDTVMPGMGGRELAERFQAAHPRGRVLYMSGYTEDEVLQRGVQAATTAFIQKPFKGAALLRTVRSVLDAPIASP